MKITSLTCFEENIPLITPFITAKRRVDTLKNIVLKIECDNGSIGYGACAPTPVITGDTFGSIVYAFENIFAPQLIGREINEELFGIVDGCMVHNTSPKAAVNIAINDLLAQEKGLPLFRYLGGESGDKVLKTDITISIGNEEKMVADCLKAVSEGYSILKIKLGTTYESDMARLKAITEVIPSNVIVRLDANQAWTPNEAIKIIEYAESTGINLDLAEQPVKFDDIEGMAFVTKNTRIKILADESVFSYEDAKRIIEMGAADMINIKLMKCGGLTQATRIHALAKSNNVECMLGCMMEGAISVSAAVHFAAAKGITRLDLDAPALCTRIPYKSSVEYNGENIKLFDRGYGLGTEGIS